MTMEQSELRVLANMVNYPEQTFDLLGRLGIREEDFSVDSNRGAYAALVEKGVCSSEELLGKIRERLPEKLRTDKELDEFVKLASSPARVDDTCISFAKGVARAKLQKDVLAAISNSTLPADMLPGVIRDASAECDSRLEAISRVSGAIPPEANGAFDGSVPTPEDLLCMPGFVNELAKYTYDTAQRPNRVTAFVGALAMLSYLAGRKFTDCRKTYPNLYLVALAGSGSGKDHPRKVNKRLAMELGTFGVVDQFSSGPGLEDALLLNPVRLFQVDEFDTLLNELKDSSSLSEGMRSRILGFFSESGSSHAMRKRAMTDRERDLLANGVRQNVAEQVIRYPSLTIFGTAIPQHFYEALSLKALTNGFLSRTLVFESGIRGKRGLGPFDAPIPDLVLQTAQTLAEREKDPDWLLKPRLTKVPDEDGVCAALEEISDEEERLYKKCARAKDEAGMAVWSRGAEIVGKLALLYAISENPTFPRVSVRGVKWAWKLVQYLFRRMLAMANAYVADDAEDADAQNVKRIVRGFGCNGVMRSAVARKLHLAKRRMDMAEATLLDREEIEVVNGKGGAKVYRLKSKKEDRK